MKNLVRSGISVEKPRFRDSEYFKVKEILKEEAIGMVKSIEEGYAYVDNNPDRHKRDYGDIVDCLVDLDDGRRWGSFSLRQYLVVMKFLNDEYNLISYYADLNRNRYTADQLSFMHPISNRCASGVFEECEKAGISAETAKIQILNIAARIRGSNWIYSIIIPK